MASRVGVVGGEELWAVIQGSFTINKHVDFFRWLQDEVSAFLPHDVLVAVWGDFNGGRLHYDVASNIPEIRTRKILTGCDVDPFMKTLHARWLTGGEKWFNVEEFGPLVERDERSENTCLAALCEMQSILVHGIRDRRGRNDCLYVFFGKEMRAVVDTPILEILVPQIDAALRRVECLAPVHPETISLGPLVSEISEREHEIMNWVQSGKTNQEIGMILNISHNTVKNHLKRIFQKMNVTTRAQAVAKYKTVQQAN